MARVGIYLRISEDRDGTQTATERQREDCETFAASREWDVADVFQDVDLSAYRRGVKRPEFERMLEAVRQKHIDGVLAWKIDRLTRRQRDLVRLDEACEEAGGFIATVVDGIDTRTATGRFVAEMLVAQARMESSNTGDRVRRKHKERATQGRAHGGGWRPFGYTHGRSAIVPDEARSIREAAERIFAGESLRGVCTDWAQRGVVTSADMPWNPTPLRRMLASPALSGQREYEGQLYPGSWEAILTTDETRRLRSILLDPSRRTAGTARSSLLTGFIFCGRCGARLQSHRHKDHRRQYACVKKPWSPDSCGRIVRFADDVEEFVTESVLTALDGVDLREYMRQPETGGLDELLQVVRADEEALEELTRDYYVERRIERAEFFSARDTLQARLEQNRQQLARTNGRGMLNQIVGAGETIRARWPEATLDWKRAVIGALVDRVVIEPVIRRTGRFQPELVKIVWKF